MKTVSTIALALVLAAGSTGAFAQSVYDSMSADTTMSRTQPLEAIGDATFFNVIKVSANDANALRFDNDVNSVRSRVSENQYASNAVKDAGYSINQVVGVTASRGDSVTLYVAG